MHTNQEEREAHTGQLEQQSETCGCECSGGHCPFVPTKSAWHNPLDLQRMVFPSSSGRNGKSPAASIFGKHK